MSGTLTLVSTGANGQGNSSSGAPSISADGTEVAFSSLASNLVAGDTSSSNDVFVKNLTTGVITLVSTGANGQGNGDSSDPQISADGTKVAFDSTASNLVAGDTNGSHDVFVKDLATGALTLVSTGADGQGNGASLRPSISADGTKVAFFSTASNLAAGDTNGRDDVFVKDLATGTLTRVSIGANGQGNDDSDNPSISADGTKIAFFSFASNLVASHKNGTGDAFVKDLATGALTLVSSGADGQTNSSFSPSLISADGTKVAFISFASNLVAGDTNGSYDVFVRDLATGVLTLVSTGASGQGNSASYVSSISADGTKVGFHSQASNLVAGDTNGSYDVFVKDLATGALTLVSTGANGQGNGDSSDPQISADGTKVAFFSFASNLVAGDTNSVADVFIKDLSSVGHGPFLASSRFGTNASAGGWVNNDTYPRELGDVNGDGRADIVGFGYAGVQVALGQSDGTFGPNRFVVADFGVNAYGYTSEEKFPRLVADVNGDGHADIVAFYSGGVYTALGKADGTFEATRYASPSFGVDTSAWSSNNLNPREMGDVNGDGLADIVGFAREGVYTASGKADGTFDAPKFALDTFGNDAGGWSNDDAYPRRVADVNGDKRADVVGFGQGRVYTAQGTTDGTFELDKSVLSDFTVNAGYTTNDQFPRQVADVNGDGRADVVAFGYAGTYTALGMPDGGFGATQFALSDFGFNAGGWSSDNLYPRQVADVNGDGRADIVGFKDDGVYVALGNANGTFF